MEESLIRNKRKKLGLTQEELGEMCGVSKTSVLNWEKRVNQPKGRYLLGISNALNITPEDIMKDSYVSNPTQSNLSKKLASPNMADEGLTGRSSILHALAEILGETHIVKAIENRSKPLEINEIEILEEIILSVIDDKKSRGVWLSK